MVQQIGDWVLATFPDKFKRGNSCATVQYCEMEVFIGPSRSKPESAITAALEDLRRYCKIRHALGAVEVVLGRPVSLPDWSARPRACPACGSLCTAVAVFCHSCGGRIVATATDGDTNE